MSFGQRMRTQGDLRPRALLVLGLLVGLIGMHALGPSTAMAAPQDRMSVHATQTAGSAVSVHADCGGCGHDGGNGDRHADHADPACASGAVGGVSALAAPTAASLDDVADAVSVRVAQCDGPFVERAPPSLAELQLLRI